MKILFLPIYYPNNPYQFLLINELVKIDVEVICVKNENQLFLFSNFNFYRTMDIIHFHWTNPYMLHKSFFKTIIKSLNFLIGLLFLKIIGVKLIYTFHNLKNHQNLHLKTEIFFLKILIKYVFDKFIVHGESVIPEVCRAFNLDDSYKEKIEIIQHGNYIDYYQNDTTKAEAKKKLKIPKEAKSFLYFGLIKEYKGIPELINAFNRLSSINNNLFLIIAGKPNNHHIRAFLNDQANPYIRVDQRFIPNDEIQYYMNAADIVVLPYIDILTSGCLLLAMSFTKAVIVPNLGCLSDTIDQNGGIIYNAADNNGLFNAMKDILPMDIEKMGEYNRKEVLIRNNWGSIAIKTKQVYCSVLISKKMN